MARTKKVKTCHLWGYHLDARDSIEWRLYTRTKDELDKYGILYEEYRNGTNINLAVREFDKETAKNFVDEIWARMSWVMYG